jgi:hypothetical protein
MPLKAAVQGRACRDGGLERVEAVVQRQKRVAPESDNDGFLLDRQGPVGKSAWEVRFLHFATVFWLTP